MSGALRVSVYGIGGLALVMVLAGGGVYGLSARAFNATYEVEPAPLAASADETREARVARGEHLSHIRGCADCHGADGGGGSFIDDAALGVLWASNLTSGEGGIAESYTDRDWDRAVRHGIGPDGRSLVFMPSYEYWALGDDDLAALMAYYRDLPPVDRIGPESRPGPLARVLYLTGQLPLVPARLVDHEAERPAVPPEGPTVEYGAYLATSCTGCHGPGLSGGRIPGGDPNWPPATNITPDPGTGIGGWSRDDLATALRTGVRPDGSTLSPVMPIQATKHFTEVEVDALYAYLTSLEPRMQGSR